MNDKNNAPNDQGRLSAEQDIPPWLQPVPEDEEPQGFLVGRKMWVMAGVAVTVVALFVAVIFALYDDGAGEPPRHIVADTSLIREKPDEPGGMDVPYQDKQVFERAGGDTLPSGEVSLAPQPEEPLDTLPEDQVSDDPIGDIAAEVTDAKPTPAAAKPEPAPAKKADVSKPKEEAPANKTAAKGFMVQLGAYGSEESAEKAWRTIRGKYGNFLSGLSPSYEAVRTGNRTLYRLRVGALDTRAAADEVCLGLRAQQQACIVVNP
ncbi:SPOR domain-containing protein [Kordiimonas aestuarii]|uniref:SPOR domain-containing protein n=1 Tax=Kordiimonas aestuarii TaxID=1005925 RepID=UPI0021CF1C1E|nr:SPOR domain-containing protein [Kordiimonas aestuarii]